MEVLKIVFLIIGAKIGAGFASGKEIFTYFAKYGIISLFFIIPLFFLFYYFVYYLLCFGANKSSFNIKDGNNDLFKNVTIKNQNIFNLFMFFTFLILSSAMFSGLVSLFKVYFPDIGQFATTIVIIIFTLILIKCSFKTLSKLSYIIVPLIIFCILLNTLVSFNTNNFATNFGITNYSLLPVSCLLYSAQNTFLASFVIIKSGNGTDAKSRHKISFLVSLILCLLLALGILCFMFNPKLVYSDMPFAEMSISLSPYFGYLFGFIIFGSIITTYATTLTSLKQYFNGNKFYNSEYGMIALVCVLSLVNFGNIVEYLYPIIGIFGLIYILKIRSSLHLSSKLFLNKSNKPIHKTSKNA